MQNELKGTSTGEPDEPKEPQSYSYNKERIRAIDRATRKKCEKCEDTKLVDTYRSGGKRIPCPACGPTPSLADEMETTIPDDSRGSGLWLASVSHGNIRDWACRARAMEAEIKRLTSPERA